MFKPIYQFKNLISSVERDSFLGSEPDRGCVSRIAFQFYPSGHGYLNKHADPVNYHQLTVPVMILSKQGVDFHEGGKFIEKENGEKIYMDAVADPGDVVFFNAQTPHGVDLIDPGSKEHWYDFEGRWMILLAVNKVQGNTSIQNSLDLEKP